jgi:hypothetical protein
MEEVSSFVKINESKSYEILITPVEQGNECAIKNK